MCYHSGSGREHLLRIKRKNVIYSNVAKDVARVQREMQHLNP